MAGETYSSADQAWLDDGTHLPAPAPPGTAVLTVQGGAPHWDGAATSAAPAGTQDLTGGTDQSGSSVGNDGGSSSLFGLSNLDLPSLDDVASSLGMSKEWMLIAAGVGVLLLAIMLHKR